MRAEQKEISISRSTDEALSSTPTAIRGLSWGQTDRLVELKKSKIGHELTDLRASSTSLYQGLIPVTM